MPSPRFHIPPGTLNMLTLQIPSLEVARSYGIAQRLEQKGWLPGAWTQSETGREAKFTSLPPARRRPLTACAVNLIFEEGSR
jgi:PadR family transcriptional regulator PadR